MPGLTAKDVLSAFMPKTQRVLPKGTVCEVKIVRAKLSRSMKTLKPKKRTQTLFHVVWP